MRGRFTVTAAFDILAERLGITVDAGTNEDLTARYRVDRGRMTDAPTSSLTADIAALLAYHLTGWSQGVEPFPRGRAL